MSGCIESVFDESAYKFKRIYIDLPGMGQSKAGHNLQIEQYELFRNLTKEWLDRIIAVL